MRARLLDVATALGGGLLTLIAAYWMVRTIGSLVGTHAPELGFLGASNAEAEALAQGQPVFADPAHALFTPPIYTPGVAGLVALIDQIHIWRGWYPLVGIVAVIGLVGLVAWLARPAERTPIAYLTAAGFGVLALWAAMALKGDLVYGPVPDHLAWLLAFAGLVCVTAPHARRRRLAAGVALLSAGFWCKQSTITVDIALVAWLAIAVRTGEWRLHRAARLAGALLAVNLVVLGVLNLLTGGWEWTYNFIVPTEHVRNRSLHLVGKEMVQGLAAAAVLAAAMLALGWRELLRGPRRSLAITLGAFVVIGAPLALVFATKQGGNDNDYLGLAWALAMLAAIAYAAPAPGRSRAGLQGVLLVALAVVAVGTAAKVDRLDLHALNARYHSIPAPLLAAAKQGTVYDALHPDLGLERGVPVRTDLGTLEDLLAAGRQPRSLVRDLVARRFDGVVPFATTLHGPGRLVLADAYASEYGRREGGYLWKLDQVIAAGYVDSGDGTGILRRRPASLDPTIGDCFAPLHVAGTTWSIRGAGGLWCHGASDGGRISFRGGPGGPSRLVSASGGPAVKSVRVKSAMPLAITVGAWSVGIKGTSIGLRAGRRLLTGVLTTGNGPVTLQFKVGAVTLDASGSTVTLPAPPPGAWDITATGPAVFDF